MRFTFIKYDLNLTISEHVPNVEKYNTKLHNTRAHYIGMQKNITQNSTTPERVPHRVKYNTKLHNTRARSTCRKIQNRILQDQSTLHTQKKITPNSIIQ